MKKVRFTETQIISILKQQEAGISIKDLSREHGVSEATIYNWKAKYGGMEANEVKRMKDLEEENNRLKRIVANLTLENDAIKTVLEKAKRGIQITGKAKKSIADIMESLLTAEGSKRIILLMEALNIIAGNEQAEVLSSIGFSPNIEKSGNDCINVIYEYSMANFKNKIHMDELADLAGISPNSFCRYFKSRTRKTYSKFLLEIRVGHACKLLIENKLPLKQLCYESGFNNFTNFHKYFKQITGKSPLNYQKEFIQTRTSSW